MKQCKEVHNSEQKLNVTNIMRSDFFDAIGSFGDDVEVYNWYCNQPKQIEKRIEVQELIDELAVASNYSNNDFVKSPKHYSFFDTEVIDIIRSSITMEQFIGYCKGNSIKYRLRAGKKDDALQDILKAEEYELYYRDIV
jgi:hypothetical protein